MTEYQLKLAKLYADLIGEDVTVSFDGQTSWLHKTGFDGHHFNPFKGQLQLDARDKFFAEIDYSIPLVRVWSGSECVTTGGDSEDCVSVAVIECILKSEGKL